MDIVGKRKIFLIASGILVAICLVSIIIFGFRLSIEFTGGSRLEISSTDNRPLDERKIRNAYSTQKIKIVAVTKNSKTNFNIRSETISEDQKNKVLANIDDTGQKIKENSFDTLGPTIGRETQINALKAIAIALVAITLYIAFAFRKVSRPISSWKFGISAIIALAHDVVIVLGTFAIAGFFLGVEVDTLFITAILTIMGFSVHDTIVVFDRIRENLLKNVRNEPFDKIVNKSFNETLGRSLNTSITVVIVLFALLLFGGESIRWFIIAFLVGIIAGTYSSIFIASAILVEWYKADLRGFKFSKLLRIKK